MVAIAIAPAHAPRPRALVMVIAMAYPRRLVGLVAPVLEVVSSCLFNSSCRLLVCIWGVFRLTNLPIAIVPVAFHLTLRRPQSFARVDDQFVVVDGGTELP